MNLTPIISMARAIREEKIALDGIAMRSWLIHECLRRLPSPQGEAAEIDACCRWFTFGSALDKLIREDRQSEEDGESTQMVLPGYERLQRSYLITRDKEPCYVALEKMTTREVRAKAAALRSNARGLMVHADELDRYANDREDAEKAAG